MSYTDQGFVFLWCLWHIQYESTVSFKIFDGKQGLNFHDKHIKDFYFYGVCDLNNWSFLLKRQEVRLTQSK